MSGLCLTQLLSNSNIALPERNICSEYIKNESASMAKFRLKDPNMSNDEIAHELGIVHGKGKGESRVNGIFFVNDYQCGARGSKEIFAIWLPVLLECKKGSLSKIADPISAK